MNIEVDTSGLNRSIRRYIVATNADINKVGRRVSKSLIQNAASITPPGNGRGGGQRAALGNDDKQRGEVAIRRDAGRNFKGVRLKNKRKEQWPDPAKEHFQLFKNYKKAGKKMPFVAPLRFVSDRKLNALLRFLISKIGRTAAGWVAAAAKVGGSLPMWVKRHGTMGRATLDEDGEGFVFTGTNTNIPSNAAPDIASRIQYAETYTANGLMREMQAVLAKRGNDFERAA